MRVITFLILTLAIISMIGAVKAGAIVEDADSVQEVGMPTVPTELESATIAPRTTVEYAQAILKSPLRMSDELLNKTSDTFPRTTAEYAQVIMKNTLRMSEELLNTTSDVASRVIVEYSSKNEKTPLVFPKELINDTTPPIITNITVTNITDNSAMVKWDTDEIADNIVKYGKASGIYTENKDDSLFVMNHIILLTGLRSGTAYYFVVNSADRSENSAQSVEYNFTTLGGIKGDLNGDDEITTTDALIALQLAVRGEYNADADVNNDGVVTSLDVLMILQAAVEKKQYAYGNVINRYMLEERSLTGVEDVSIAFSSKLIGKRNNG